MWKACIFDLDGTLANTLDSMAVVMNAVLRSYDLKELPVDNYRYYCGEGASVLVRRCLEAAGDSDLQYYEEAEKKYRRQFDEDPLFKVSHYPGMPETLRYLKEKGIPLGVCSNKPDIAAQKVVKEMFGTELFLEVAGQSEQIRRKPAPDGPLAIAKAFQVKPEECLYIGDTKTDMQTGKAAGMYTIGVLWGFRDKEELVNNGADIVIEHPEQLKDFFEERT